MSLRDLGSDDSFKLFLERHGRNVGLRGGSGHERNGQEVESEKLTEDRRKELDLEGMLVI